jgi:hypothetical protein
MQGFVSTWNSMLASLGGVFADSGSGFGVIDGFATAILFLAATLLSRRRAN